MPCKTQPPVAGDTVTQQDAQDRQALPGRPVHRHAAPEVRHLLGRRAGLRKTPHELHEVEVGREVGHAQALAARQAAQVGPPLGRQDQEAQVDAGGGGQQHPGGGAGGQQRDHRQLRAAGKHQQRHRQRHWQAEPGLDHRHAGDQAPGGDADGRAGHVACAQAEGVVAHQRREGLHAGIVPSAPGPRPGPRRVSAGSGARCRPPSSSRRRPSQTTRHRHCRRSSPSATCWR